MANLTIRNLDDEVVEKLKARAKAHHRSLEAELRTLLSDAAARPSRDEFVKIADRIAAMRSAAFKNSSREGRAAASLRSARSSASSERWWALARALSFATTSSSRLRIVRLAISSSFASGMLAL